jgi:predicted ATPase
MQRNSYELSVLSADFNTQVSAGEVFPINVVLKKVGFNRLHDVYVIVSIPELGVYTRAYVGDLLEKEVSTSEKEDSYSTVVYLKVPENAKVGTYETLVRVYNSDAETIVTKLVNIKDLVRQ